MQKRSYRQGRSLFLRTRVNEEEHKLIFDYARRRKMSVSELFRRIVMSTVNRVRRRQS